MSTLILVKIPVNYLLKEFLIMEIAFVLRFILMMEQVKFAINVIILAELVKMLLNVKLVKLLFLENPI